MRRSRSHNVQLARGLLGGRYEDFLKTRVSPQSDSAERFLEPHCAQESSLSETRWLAKRWDHSIHWKCSERDLLSRNKIKWVPDCYFWSWTVATAVSVRIARRGLKCRRQNFVTRPPTRDRRGRLLPAETSCPWRILCLEPWGGARDSARPNTDQVASSSQ
jgi:hypothetical protein